MTTECTSKFRLNAAIHSTTVIAQSPRLVKWMGISLLLHASLVIPVFLLRHMPQTPTTQQKLAVELFGMVANRQTEAKQVGKREDENQPKEESRRKIAAQVRHEEKKSVQSLAESPVQVAKAEEYSPPQPVAAPSVPRGEDEQQKQQTLRNVDPQVTALRKYLALLGKLVNAKVIYPQEVKQAGKTGTPVISFRIGLDGQIEPGTLVLRKSSGDPLMDDNALNAARAATPLPAPPAAMSVALDVDFFEGKNR